MGWVVSVSEIVVLASGVLALVLALETLRHRSDPMAWPVALLLCSAAAWAFPYGLSIGATSPETTLFWNRLRYPGTVVVPLAYFAVAMTYAGKREWFSRRLIGALSVVPLGMLVGVFTNRYHGYFWQSTSVTRVNETAIVAFDPGVLFWTNLLYSYALVGTGLALLIYTFFRSGPIYRKQSALLVVGGAAPLLTNIAVNVLTEPGSSVDFTMTALTISGGAFAVALFHFDLLDLRPVARDTLVEELDDAVIVADHEGTVVDVNGVGEAVLDDPSIGDPIEAVLPEEINGVLSDENEDGHSSGPARSDEEFVVQGDGRTRIYRCRSTPITDQLDRRTGHIIYLDDVTDLVEREQRISVLNRVLQHNVRNELSLVIGHLDSAMETATDPTADHITEARESASQVIELSNKARTLERTINTSATTEAVPVSTTLDRVLEDVRSAYPDATFETATSEEQVSVAVASETLFEATVENLLENAVVHNDSDRPRATVRVEKRDSIVRLSVRDNGPGIPEGEFQILQNRTETPLDHGSGLGLWIAKWTATLSDGDLTITERESGGTAVTLSLPIADD
ncbi:PAS domain S-box protein [Natrarchaeobius halalkaliphilus]|uniref:histidine kinase n=1 Tax=Natrarchaeobius halalkaliphilus TaxID=1679091 RepID=A0A3N6MUM5_9EURY|nr:histidine kinase N-terminal 7TM domain-containing protein [Natrarchaeobius halalkaliphilus]RQG89102.1 PAS domain S-box protein [Natrarchaeobius halalkaliphilus]